MNPYDTTTVTGYITGTLIASLLIGLIGLVFAIIIYWRIFSKAGYSGARSLLMLIPLVNLIIIIMFAFSEWPIQRELNQLRQAASGRPGGFPSQYPPQGPQYQQPGQYPQYGQPQGAQYQQPPQYGQPQYGQPQGPQSGQYPQQR